MNQHVQAHPAPTATPAQARKLAEELMQSMAALLDLIERETELVRAGNIAEAMTLGERKSELSHRYRISVAGMQAAQPYLKQAAPELLATLHRNHDTFRAMLQVNLTVLATAHAVSEGVVRGVNAEVQRRNIPNTYTAAGQRAEPGSRNIRPLAVSRSL